MKELSERKIKQNLMLYTLGSLVSLMGTYMYNFAVGLYVLKMTGSGTSYALTVVFGILPRVILSPFAGIYADKVNKKTVVVLTDLLSGVLLLGLFFITRSTEISLVMIYASSALLTVLNVFFGISFEAATPNLVDDKRLMQVNSISSSIRALAMILAPILGGILYVAVGIKTFILVNGISFFLSGLSENFIDFKLNSKLNEDDAKPKSQSVMADFKEGLEYIKGQRSIRTLIKYALIINFLMMSFNVVYPYIMIVEIKLTDVYFGIVEAAFAVGTLIFSIVLSTKKSDNGFSFKRIGKLMLILSGLVLAIGVIGSPMISLGSLLLYTIILFVINFAAGADLAVLNIPVQTELMKRIDEEHRGKVLGLLGSMAMGISPIAAMMFGLLLEIVPGYLLMIVTAVLLMILSVMMFREKNMDQDDLDLQEMDAKHISI